MIRPQVFAFFDVDETLIRIKSMVSFQEFWCSWSNTPEECESFAADMKRLIAGKATREFMNRRYYSHFAGRPVASVRACAKAWFNYVTESDPQLFNENVVAELRRHQQTGERPVLVSGSFPDVLIPIAQRLGLHHVLCTRLVSIDGHYTGEIHGSPMIGPGKAQAVGNFLAAHHARAESCHAYGDDISDRFMLAAVGNPVVVAGQPAMESHAKQRAWTILSAAASPPASHNRSA